MTNLLKFAWSNGNIFERICMVLIVPFLFMVGLFGYVLLTPQAIVTIVFLLILLGGGFGIIYLLDANQRRKWVF